MVSISNQPSPKRKHRWDELNKALEIHAKFSRSDNSTAYSSVTWDQVKEVFQPTKYVQSRRNINVKRLNFLSEYLSYTTQCFGIMQTGREAMRLYFIAPILVCVCSHFDGDVVIAAEEDLKGKIVKAHGHFEFMLKRGNKAVCIVETKRDDFEQGIAQDLVGCEVAAEVGGLHVVYGIVTNYMEWTFLRSLDDRIELDGCTLRLQPKGPHINSLKEICEKIYAMLSND